MSRILCLICGSQVQKNHAYCPGCGTPLNKRTSLIDDLKFINEYIQKENLIEEKIDILPKQLSSRKTYTIDMLLQKLNKKSYTADMLLNKVDAEMIQHLKNG